MLAQQVSALSHLILCWWGSVASATLSSCQAWSHEPTGSNGPTSTERWARQETNGLQLQYGKELYFRIRKVRSGGGDHFCCLPSSSLLLAREEFPADLMAWAPELECGSGEFHVISKGSILRHRIAQPSLEGLYFPYEQTEHQWIAFCLQIKRG